MVRLKRFFMYTRKEDFSDVVPPSQDELESMYKEIDYIKAIDHEHMEDLVKGIHDPSEEKSEKSQLLGEISALILSDEK